MKLIRVPVVSSLNQLCKCKAFSDSVIPGLSVWSWNRKAICLVPSSDLFRNPWWDLAICVTEVLVEGKRELAWCSLWSLGRCCENPETKTWTGMSEAWAVFDSQFCCWSAGLPEANPQGPLCLCLHFPASAGWLSLFLIPLCCVNTAQWAFGLSARWCVCVIVCKALIWALLLVLFFLMWPWRSSSSSLAK